MRWLGGTTAVFGAMTLAGCGMTPVAGAYTGKGSTAVKLSVAAPSKPASMFSVQDGTYTLVGRGAGIGAGANGNVDDLSYYFEQVNADGTWSCYVEHVGGTKNDGGLAFGGLMARTSAAPDAPNVAVMVTDGNGVLFEWRQANGQGEEQYPMQLAIGVTAPIWVRLQKSSSAWYVSYSQNNGKTWPNVLKTIVPFDEGKSFLVGLAATSHDVGAEVLDVFKDVKGFAPNQYISIAPKPGSATAS